MHSYELEIVCVGSGLRDDEGAVLEVGVYVGSENFAFDLGEGLDDEVFTNLEGVFGSLDGFCLFKGFGVGRGVLADGDELRKHFFEGFVAGDEVGFAGDDHYVSGSSFYDDLDLAFGGFVAGALGGLGDTLFAEDFDGCFDVSVGFDEGVLAVSHSYAGTVAEFLDHLCGNHVVCCLGIIWSSYLRLPRSLPRNPGGTFRR